MSTQLQIQYRNAAELIPYINNAKVHEPAQVDKIAASINEFGFNNPILLDGENGVIAGHGRLMAANKLKMDSVPTIELGHLNEQQKKAYIFADNRLAEVDTSWDFDLVSLELDALKSAGFDIGLTGFDDDFILNADLSSGDLSDNYSRKIEAPIYEPKEDAAPDISDLCDQTKTHALKDEIEAAALPPTVREFLNLAADRHTVFDFRKIAEFYAHTDAETQDLMERSALVIVDYDKAIENGFVKISKGMQEQAEKSKAKNHAGR